MRLPETVRDILNKLETAGFQAYAVGGCVRDSILGKEPDDWDLTTDARPEEVKALFPRTVDTGLQHGTVTVLLGGEGYEVTTYRIDGSYSDGRHHQRDGGLRARRTCGSLRRTGRPRARLYPLRRGSVCALSGGCAPHAPRGAFCGAVEF